MENFLIIVHNPNVDRIFVSRREFHGPAPKMNPSCSVAASIPLAAIWPLLGLAEDGDTRFSHEISVSSFFASPQVFHSLLRAPLTLICSAQDFGAARSWPSAAASRYRRPLQNVAAAAKDEHAEFFTTFPLAAALGKKFYDLEGCSLPLVPPLSTQNSRFSTLSLQNLFTSLDLLGWSNCKLFGAEYNDKHNDIWTLSSSPLKPLRQVQETKALQSTCLITSQICRGKRNSDFSASFQIHIRLITGKTLLQWVSSSDLVQNLKHALQIKLGLPSAAQRLLHEGKQLEDLYPLSFYSIKRDASITLTLRLRGGAVGQSSSAAAFSYKDAVHA